MSNSRRASKLRIFLFWSVMLHIGAALFWGVPAWHHMQAERALAQEQQAQAEKRAQDARVAQAQAQAQQAKELRAQVEAQVRQQFDKLTAAIAEEKRNKLWEDVAARLQDETKALASALSRADLTEQDLLNLETRLQRDLVEQTDQALDAATAEELAENFLAQVDGQVAPELAKWMRDQVNERLAKLLREEAERLAREQRDGARQAAAQAAAPAAGVASNAASRESFARQDLRAFGQGDLKAHVEEEFAKDLRAETLPRLKPKLAKAFLEQLTQAGVTNNQLAEAVATHAIKLLSDKVPALAKAGEPISERFKDLAPDSDSVAADSQHSPGTQRRLPSAADSGLSAPETASGDAAAGESDTKLAAGKAGRHAPEQASGDAATEALDKKLAAGKAQMLAKANGSMGQLAKEQSMDDHWAKVSVHDLRGDAAMAEARDHLSRMAEGMRSGRLGNMAAGTGSGLGSLHRQALSHGPHNGLIGSGYRDEAAYRAVSQQIADRGQVQGEAWKLTGASGEASQAVVNNGSIPARAVGRDNALAKAETGCTNPYAPNFKTLAFASIPCLPGNFAVDGKAEKWKDIPAITLKPEQPQPMSQTVQIGWRSDGLFFRYNITDPDHRYTKNVSSLFWLADSVEVWVDCLNLKQKYRSHHIEQQFWVWPDGGKNSPAQTGGEAVQNVRNAPWIPREYQQGTLPRVTEKTPQGYIMEFQLPVALLNDADLAPGRIIGFNTCVNPYVEGYLWYWSAGGKASTYCQPDTWGDLLLAGSDAKLGLATRPEAKTAAPVILVAGQPLRLRVVDGDMNLSPLRRDKVMVTLKPEHGGQQIAVLEETSENSGIFEGAVSTALALDEDQPGLLSVYDGETVQVTYIDQARANGSRNVDVTLALKFGSSLVQGVAAAK